jgi:signal transduction histidine kinase
VPAFVPTPSLLDPGSSDPALAVLDAERDRAERFLNRVRQIVLVLLGIAAAIYATKLPTALDIVNVVVLVPTLAWSVLQQVAFHRRPRLPAWLGIVNPLVDTTAATAILGGYALAASPALALKTPILAAYFVILAALPVASSTRKAALVSGLVVAEYALLVIAFGVSGRLRVIMDPVAASGATGISPLDEGAKLLLLACAGAVATYATRWQERLAMRYAEASERSTTLKSRLDRSELQALKLQLQPHFLFNTLNAITALLHRDPVRAERMVSGLSELLRVSLGSAGEQEVTLARELEVLRHYVDIQQVRFQDRLTVVIDAPPEVDRALVPNLILQPLVENAIKHGLSSRAAAGRVEVRARHEGDQLMLSVRDNGVGEGAGVLRREGVGLGNARARLTSLYGDAHHFEAGNANPGFRVEIVIPWHVQPRDALHPQGLAAVS